MVSPIVIFEWLGSHSRIADMLDHIEQPNLQELLEKEGPAGEHRFVCFRCLSQEPEHWLFSPWPLEKRFLTNPER